MKFLEKYKCFYCERPFGYPHGESYRLDATIDHIVPIIKQGSSKQFNLVVSCQFCNTLKSGHSLPSFIELIDSLTEANGIPESRFYNIIKNAEFLISNNNQNPDIRIVGRFLSDRRRYNTNKIGGTFSSVYSPHSKREKSGVQIVSATKPVNAPTLTGLKEIVRDSPPAKINILFNKKKKPVIIVGTLHSSIGGNARVGASILYDEIDDRYFVPTILGDRSFLTYSPSAIKDAVKYNGVKPNGISEQLYNGFAGFNAWYKNQPQHNFHEQSNH